MTHNLSHTSADDTELVYTTQQPQPSAIILPAPTATLSIFLF